MITTLLTNEEVLAGFDAVSALYPYTPSLCMWRAWEIAAYRRCRLAPPVLDLGCGDGAFFRLAWPGVMDVTGVDMDAAAVHAARASGIYRDVVLAPAQSLLVAQGHFMSAFANCSVEHMDDLPRVFRGIWLSLRPGGEFLFSVITRTLLEWNPLPPLAQRLGGSADKVRADYRDYHHYGSPPTLEQWITVARDAGFEIAEHIPVMPEVMSRACLFLDNLWHVGAPANELGGALQAHLQRYPQFPAAMRHFMSGLLTMEQNSRPCGGAVLRVKKPDGVPV
ncbi:MAG: Methyltransferase type 11 [Phycisphaerales bacterium]|jgi:SAM-dependent methyltransferase|nr:Methyltransferase type 11 [Phycisphaerales bacterium]MDB5358475.1 Methyltransferase type 11 [Phycisphaerales bacterium]